MNDRELLELAAKAAGVVWIDEAFDYDDFGRMMLDFGQGAQEWNPLTDDGDALRFAVKLNLSIDLFDDAIFVGYTPNCNDCDQVREELNNDPYAATRRAIVRAAAEIGKEMK